MSGQLTATNGWAEASSSRSRLCKGTSKPRNALPAGKPTPLPYTPSHDPAREEQRSVHDVYERIAPHFSQTRYKPWPLVERFLRSLPPNSLGLDSGAGNGKYLPTAREAGVEMVALDRSAGLLSIARDKGECVRGDLNEKPWRRGVYDFAISIAAIHHLSTPERRRQSVEALLHPLRLAMCPPYSRFLVYVWAYEQGRDSKRRMGAQADLVGDASGSAGDTEKVQDVLVPWVLPKRGEPSTAPRTPVGSSGDAVQEPRQGDPDEPHVYHRYYHLFVHGELQELVEEAATYEGFALSQKEEGQGLPPGKKWLRVVDVGWEADNWWLEGEVGVKPA